MEISKKWSRDQKSFHIGFPLQNKMMPQCFLLFLMIFMQAELKIIQTNANILLNCLLFSVSVQF